MKYTWMGIVHRVEGERCVRLQALRTAIRPSPTIDCRQTPGGAHIPVRVGKVQRRDTWRYFPFSSSIVVPLPPSISPTDNTMLQSCVGAVAHF